MIVLEIRFPRGQALAAVELCVLSTLHSFAFLYSTLNFINCFDILIGATMFGADLTKSTRL